MLVEETVAEELQGKRLHALRRGRIITDDELRTVDRQSKGPEVIDDVSSSQQGELEEVNDPNDSVIRKCNSVSHMISLL